MRALETSRVFLVIAAAALALGTPQESRGDPLGPKKAEGQQAQQVSSGSSKPPASVAEALERVERARAALAAAVARIEKERPSTKDLEAAKVAVERLQEVLDLGSEFEPKDLDYARAALAARKEIRKRRGYILQRREEARLEASRHVVESAFTELKAAVESIRGGDSTAKAYQRARAAVAGVKKAVQQAAPLAEDSKAHARYLAEVRTRMAKQEGAIRALEVKAAVTEKKAGIEEADAALETALSRLKGDDIPDAHFQEAEKAAVRLDALLDGAKDLEADDQGYRAFASKTRARLKKARARIDAQWSEVGLARLKAEIEPARADLAQAARPLKKRRPTEAQLAEARNAAIIVEKLLERYEGLAGKPTALGRYIREVGASLAEVQIVLQRRQVETARAAVEAVESSLKRRDVPKEKFAEAERAVKEAKAVLAAGKKLESDREYRAYAREVRRQLNAARDRFAKRQVELAVERHKAAIEAARRDVQRSLGLLKRRRPTDDHFDEAKTAATVFAKTLDEADTKDAGFARYVLEQRKWLRAARREMRGRRVEVEIDRQRRAVEEGRRGITVALRGLRGKDVPDERFTAAEEAVKKAAGILKGGAALAKKDREYATYAREVRKRLREARETMKTRRHEVAVYRQTAQVNESLTTLKRRLPRLPTTAEVKEAEAAVAEVRNALAVATDQVKKDRKYRSFAASAEKVIATANARIERRKDEIATDAQIAQVEEALAALKGAMAKLDTLSPEAPAFVAASEALKRANATLDQGKALEKKLRRYASWANRVRKSLQGDAQRIEKRKLEVSVGTSRARTDELIGAARATLAAAERQSATEEDVARALESAKALKEALESAAALEKRDRGYAAYAGKAKEELARLEAKAEQARHVIAFRKGPLGELSAGVAAAETAAKTTDLREQKSRYVKALERFKACQKGSADMIGDHPRIASAVVVTGTNQVTAKDTITMCANHAQAVEEKLKAVNAVLAFYDGPAKSFEEGTALLKSGDEPKALKHFESCLASGRILQYKHPELKKRKFDVAGEKVTLPGLIDTCDAQAKKLR